MEWSHKAIKIVQRPDADPFYIMAADATEILQWADVPRKKANYMAGYQRELDDRHKKLSEFFLQDPKNIVPGAVIIAIDNEALKISHDTSNVFTIKIEHTEKSITDLLHRTHESFVSRLGDSEKQSLNNLLLKPDELDDDDETTASDNDDEFTEPDSYLTLLTAELARARRDGLESLSEDRQQAITDYLSGIAKPGLVLDGQHRVFAAKNVDDFAIQLPVVLMPGLKEAEQVFHFYVLNNKAKPLKPTELRSTVSTSLSMKEITDLYDRLRKSGVKSEEARWTHVMNTSPESPFRGIIDFGFRDGGGFIPENVAFQIASKFMKPPKKFRLLHTDVNDWSDQEYRLSLFFRFWNTIREKYQDAWVQAVQAQEGQIFYKATMLCLQELIFDALVQEVPRRKMRKQDSPFASAEELETEVKASLFFLPGEFFTRDWTETGLDTPERRKFLVGQMKEAINRQGEKLGHLQLFKKK